MDKEKSSLASSRPLEPYRRMMPGMRVKTGSSPAGEKSGKEQADREGEEGEGEEGEEDDDEEGDKPALPTPRKRLMNFKIPLVRGSQRRDQQHSVVARRRLYKDEQLGKPPTNLPPPPLTILSIEDTAPKRSERGYYSDISSSEYFTSSESEGEESSEEGDESDVSVEPELSRYV